jgi:hypothetical protein
VDELIILIWIGFCCFLFGFGFVCFGFGGHFFARFSIYCS